MEFLFLLILGGIGYYFYKKKSKKEKPIKTSADFKMGTNYSFGLGLGRGLIQESIYHQSAEILSIKQAIDKSSKTLRWIFYGLVLLLLLEFTKR